MIQDILKEAQDHMQKAIEVLKKEFATMRVGRATPALLEKVVVEYYGTQMPVNQLATISAPEPRLLVIQPWDKGALGAIEKAILKSDLGITPTNDGSVIRLAIPPLTQERRQELVKVARKKAEEARVAIRNIRRDANDRIKDLEKDKVISEDEGKRGQDEVQKLTDKFIKTVDELLKAKEDEILSI
ncbi:MULTISPECIES: ribosome recycling factor [Carboxydothermus]|uniref:Ribosome-recycling factor n=2 Tax=Carboxydothermus TaxID=129957 RepID=RRF_CARHZ|nr:RecName: Full=Ribosome-recycling factor; Short=RRF; AltName: Full=Ribosome-releasing factor [Carboxydothermus hydrogenoformans Z-2901]ABB16154.1 ribosome recycling factor [Carboxydothermus hydrogenoformans Z-2901]NYE58533.1 ribosome recycling factor [Carboxydothermus ferrireducens DSM 11255]